MFQFLRALVLGDNARRLILKKLNPQPSTVAYNASIQKQAVIYEQTCPGE